MSHILHANSTHTNITNRCRKLTALVKEVTSNFLGRETYEWISNVPSLRKLTQRMAEEVGHGDIPVSVVPDKAGGGYACLVGAVELLRAECSAFQVPGRTIIIFYIFIK